jgi:hypothetical protein
VGLLADNFQDSSTAPPLLRPAHFANVFSTDLEHKGKIGREEERSINIILERLRSHGIATIVESNARYALRANGGDVDKALSLLILLQETYEGMVRPYDPHRRLVGAINRESVTCYLDALLFAMFMRLDSFEAMLYDSLEDPNKKRLAGMLRLWVNMMRTGKIITTDITKDLQAALASCGWTQAAKLLQQDPSEAFTFITDQLQLPLLTLKMDLYHTGKADLADDHKFVNERLLEVAVLEQPREGKAFVTLEDCLEQYFNNRIEVMRYLENQRQNSFKATGSMDSSYTSQFEKEVGVHIEVLEVAGTPLVQTPISDEAMFPLKVKDPVLARLRPEAGRKRQDSIFSQRRSELVGVDPGASQTPTSDSRPSLKASSKTEVLMPAWQFFKLLPWYTDHMPTSDAQVAAHFATKRPVLGICLKRYSFNTSGQATKLDTHIDIPLEIQVPNFLSDEQLQDDIDSGSVPVGGNFRLLLQSVVCHRGVSVHSGHYVALCRGTPTVEQRHRQHQAQARSESSSLSEDHDELPDPWVRFDDLAKERVTVIDIHEALKKETPYLLFYQVQPIGEDGKEIHDLPSYAEATSRAQSDVGLSAELEKADRAEFIENAPNQETNNAPDAVRARSMQGGNSIGGSRNSWNSAEFSESYIVQPGASKRSSRALSEPELMTRGDPSTSNNSSSTKNGYGHGNGAGNSFLAIASRLGNAGSKSRAPKSSGAAQGQRPVSSGSSEEKDSKFTFNVARLTQKLGRSPDKDVTGPVLLPPTPSQSSFPTTQLDGVDAPANGSYTELAPSSSDHTGILADRPSLTLPRLETSEIKSARRPSSAAFTALPAVTSSGSTSHEAAQQKRHEKAQKRDRQGRSQEDRDCTVM